MKRKDRSRTPELLARIFEALVVTATALLIVLAGGILLLHLFGVQTYIVMSGSMEPEIHTGAIALIDTTDRYVTTGDIVAYRMGEGDDEILITHRIMERTEEGFITKGDANTGSWREQRRASLPREMPTSRRMTRQYRRTRSSGHVSVPSPKPGMRSTHWESADLSVWCSGSPL